VRSRAILNAILTPLRTPPRRIAAGRLWAGAPRQEALRTQTLFLSIKRGGAAGAPATTDPSRQPSRPQLCLGVKYDAKLTPTGAALPLRKEWTSYAFRLRLLAWLAPPARPARSARRWRWHRRGGGCGTGLRGATAGEGGDAEVLSKAPCRIAGSLTRLRDKQNVPRPVEDRMRYCRFAGAKRSGGYQR
jgi:hypothetical protein